METEENKEGQEQSTQTQQGGNEQSTTPDRYTELMNKVSEGEEKQGEKIEEKEETIEIEQEAKDKLTELGYNDEDLKNLKPDEIQKIIDGETKKEISDEEKISIDDTKLIFEKGKDKTELSKIDLGDGNFAYVPEHLKGGLLMQNDYTKKTMKLSEERKEFESQRQTLETLRDKLFELSYIDELGQPFSFEEPEEPYKRDFIDDEKYLDRDEAEKAYEKAKKEWKVKKEEWDKNKKGYEDNKANLKILTQQVLAKNNEMLENFEKKYGKPALETTFKKAQSYINPHVFKGTVPYPEDALELIYKGMKYDEDIKNVQKETAKKTVENLNDKQRKVIKITKGREVKTDTPSAVIDRYKWVDNLPK